MAEQDLNPHIRLIRQVAITTLLWMGSLTLTNSEWLQHSERMPLRVLLVAIGLAGFVPIVFVYARSIQLQDEFNQRIHLIALAVAFAGLAVISYAADLLVKAGFISRLPSTGLWALMIALWFISMLATPRFYR